MTGRGPRIELTWPGKYTEEGRRRIAEPLHVTPRLHPQERFGTGEATVQDPTPCRLILGENRLVMEALLAEPSPPAFTVIYLDPPFAAQTTHAARIPLGAGKRAELPAYPDRFVPEAYLEMMATRLELARRLLAPTGLLFLHCDTRASAWLQLLLDEIFGRERFVNEIIWHYRSGGRPRDRFAAKHDTILVYAAGKKWHFDRDAVGEPRGVAKRNNMKREVDENGRSVFTIRSNGRVYRYSEDERMSPADVWTDISHLQQRDPQRTGYPTQKPAALLERILLAASRPGDWVADFFAGSGTTAAVAARLGRRFVVSDVSELAVQTTRQRLREEPALEVDVELATLGESEAQQFHAACEEEAAYRAAVLEQTNLVGERLAKACVHVAGPHVLEARELERIAAQHDGPLLVLAWLVTEEARDMAEARAHLTLARIPRTVLLPSPPSTALLFGEPRAAATAHYEPGEHAITVQLERYELELLAGPPRLKEQLNHPTPGQTHLIEWGILTAESGTPPRLRAVAPGTAQTLTLHLPPSERTPTGTLQLQLINRFGHRHIVSIAQVPHAHA